MVSAIIIPYVNMSGWPLWALLTYLIIMLVVTAPFALIALSVISFIRSDMKRLSEERKRDLEQHANAKP